MTELQLIWGWQPALYLFLGGMGAGAFVMAAVLYFYDRENSAGTIRLAAWSAMLCLVVGLLLLLSELTNPLRGMMLWQSFSRFTSWMTFGAWAVLVAVISFGIVAVCSTPQLTAVIERAWSGYRSAREGVRGVFVVIGLALGFVVAIYTGVLLMSAPGVPLWNT